MAEDVVGKSVLEVGADGTTFETAIAGMTRSATDFERKTVDAAGRAGKAVSGVGDGAAQAAAKQEAASKRFVAAVEKEINQLALSRAEYRKLQAEQLGIADSVYTPLIRRLADVKAAQDAAARSVLAQAEAQRQAAAAQAEAVRAAAENARVLQATDAAQKAYLASLREQIALFGRSSDEIQRYKAAQLGVGAAAAPLLLQLQNQRAAQERAAAAARDEAEAQRQATAAKRSAEAASQSFIRQLQEQVALQGKSQTEVLRYRAAQLGITTDADKYISAIEAANKKTGQFGVSVGQTTAAMRQLPAQFTDIFTSLQGGQNPFTVLIQQGGQIKDSFGSVGNAVRALGALITPAKLLIGGVATVAGVAAIAFKNGAEEADAYRKAIVLTGNASGTTVGQLQQMAVAIDGVVGTQAKAAETLAQFAATGKIAASDLGKVAEAAIRLEREGGPAIEKTVAAFASLADEPLKASLKLNEGTRFLTVAIYEQIRALEEQGRAAEAASVAQNAFADATIRRTKELESQLGVIPRLWRSIADTAKEAWDAMLGIGRAETIESRVSAATKEVERARSKLGRPFLGFEFGDTPDSGDDTEERRALEKQGVAQSDARFLKVEAERQAAVARTTQEYAKASEEIKKWSDLSVSKTEQASKALEKYRKNVELINAERRKNEIPLISDAEIQRTEAAIRKQFAGPKERQKQDTFGPQLRDIEDLIKANERRIESGRDLTKAEELEIRLNNRLADSLKDLSKPQQERLRLAIAQAVASQATFDTTSEELKAAKKIADERVKLRKKEDDEIDNAIQKRRDEANASAKALTDRVNSVKQEAQALALSRKQNIDVAAAIELVTIARLEEKKSFKTEGSPEFKELQAEIDKRKELAGLIESNSVGKAIDDFLDPNKAKSFGDALTAAFDGAGNALVRLSNVFSDYAGKQDSLQKLIERNAKDSKASPEERLRRQNGLIAEQGKLQIETFASMAGAAKGFFTENTKGYRALQAAETAFRAFQLASDLVRGISAAKVAIASQGQGEPYSAFARMAIMAAAMASLGFATGFFGRSGGGSNASAQQRQDGAATGRVITPDQVDPSKATFVIGTVFGAGDEKSESIARALKAIEDSSDLALDYQSGMLAALRNIENSLAGLGNLVVRTAGGGLTTGKNLGIQTGTIAVNRGDPALGFLGLDDFGRKLPIIGGAIEKLQAIFGKTTQEIADSGLAISGTVASLAGGTGVQQFADVKTTQSSFFGLSKKTTDSTVFAEVEAQIAKQFGLVFRNIGDTLALSAGVLGKEGEQFQAAIDAFVVDIPRLSLKDLKGQELQDAINAAIGAAADSLAFTVLPGLDDFQKIGEGYFETLIRVASGIETANYQLELLGVTAIDYTEILRTQADVAAEIVRQSLQGAETVGGVLSSIGVLIGSVDGSSDKIAETYGKLVDVRDILQDVGIAGDALTSSLIRGAGGLDALTSSAGDYFQEFFTEAERTGKSTARLAEDFAKLGLALPASRDEFESLVDGIDETSASGQLLLAKVLGLAGAFDKVADSAEAAYKTLLASIERALPKFQTPEEQRQGAAGRIAADLKKGAGIDLNVGQLLGFSTDDIFDFAKAFVALQTNSDAAKTVVVNAAEALLDLKNAAEAANRSLQTAIENLLGRVETPQQRIASGIGRVGRDLQTAGIFSDVPTAQLNAVIAGLTETQILDLVRGFTSVATNSVEAKQAVVAAALAMFDLADAAREIQRTDIQKQLDAITRVFGDVSVVVDPVEKLADAFVRNRNEAKALEGGLDNLLGRTVKTVQEALADMLQGQKALTEFRTGTLADAIENARQGTLTPEGRLAAKRANRDSLFSQLGSAKDPLEIAQRLQGVIVDIAQEEANLKLKSLDDQENALKRLRDLSKEIAQFTASLRFSDISPLSFDQQLGAARSLFETTLAGAKAGDTTAQGNLTGNARAFLDEARSYYASGSAYGQIFSQVTSSLDALGLAGAQVDPQLAALELLTTTVGDGSAEIYLGLQQLNGAVLAREVQNATLIGRQIELAEQQLKELKALIEAQAAILRQQFLSTQTLNGQLELLNTTVNRNTRIGELAGARS